MSKKIFSISIGAVSLLLLFVLYLIFPKALDFAERGATIKVDGEVVKKRPARFWPGRHVVEIARRGKVTHRSIVRVDPLKPKTIVPIILEDLPKPQAIFDRPLKFMVFDRNNLTITGYSPDTQAILRFHLAIPVQTSDPQAPIKAFKEEVTPRVLDKLEQIVWSPDYLLAFFKKSDGEVGLYDFARYDLLRQEFRSWGQGVGGIAWRGDGKRVLYIFSGEDGEKTLILTDRTHQNPERVFNLAGEKITAGQLTWSKNGKGLLMVANGSLYFFTVQTKTLTKVVDGGVSSAQLSPEDNRVVFTRHGQLSSIDLTSIDPFSDKPADQANIGKIIVSETKTYPFKAEAGDSVFVNNNTLITADNRQLVQLDLLTGQSQKFQHQTFTDRPTHLILGPQPETLLLSIKDIIHQMVLKLEPITN